MRFLVGTASWTDKTLIDCGRFYPADCKTPEARLRFYASNFPLVEVDSSYYAIPVPATAQLWVERTPDDFVFNVKAFRLFTGHWTETKVLHKDIHQERPGVYIVNASATIRALNRALQWQLPTDGPKTLNGLLLELLETIPEPGTALRVGGYEFEVLQTGDNVIRTVRVRPIPADDGARELQERAAG